MNATQPSATERVLRENRPNSEAISNSKGTTDFNRSKRNSSKRLPTILKWVTAAVLVLIAALIFRSFYGQKGVQVLSTTAKRGLFKIVVVETGELRAKHSVNITAPPLASGGRAQLAIRYLAPEGTTVDSGTLIVSFDPQDMSKALSDKEDQLTLDESDLAKTKAQESSDKAQSQMDLENAKLSFELAKLTNASMKFESQSKQREAELDMEKAKLTLAQAKQNLKGKLVVQKSELENLLLKVTQDKAAIERIESDIKKLDVHAPSAGLIVYNNNWTTGRKFAKGDQIYSAQALGALPDLSQMQADIQVNEVDISKVKMGQSAEIRLDAFPDKSFHGKVISVGAIGNKKENNPSIKVFDVTVDIDSADPVLKPGMTVNARIAIDQLENVVSIPLECVFEDGGKTVAYVQNGSDWEKRVITLGPKNDNFVVVESGIKAGERVSMSDPTQTASRDVPSSSSTDAQSSKGAGQSTSGGETSGRGGRKRN